jgi:hypothetical protein
MRSFNLGFGTSRATATQSGVALCGQVQEPIDLPPHFHAHMGAASSATISTLWDNTADIFGLGIFAIADQEILRSLTKVMLGQLEVMVPGRLELPFDLTESARTVRHATISCFCHVFNCIHRAALQTRTAKRTTLTWMDLSASGFSRTPTTPAWPAKHVPSELRSDQLRKPVPQIASPQTPTYSWRGLREDNRKCSTDLLENLAPRRVH